MDENECRGIVDHSELHTHYASTRGIVDQRECAVIVDQSECGGIVDQSECRGIVDQSECGGIVDQSECGWCAGTMDQSEHEEELKELKASLQDTQPVGALVSACR